jgi:hypothetical protein
MKNPEEERRCKKRTPLLDVGREFFYGVMQGIA